MRVSDRVRAESRQGARGSRGFTLLEVTIATMIFTVLGFVFLKSSEMGRNSHDAVRTSINRSQSMRATRSSIADEFKTAASSSITVTTLEDGNHELTFMMPITVSGTSTWGVHDRSLGLTQEEHNRENWTIRYTVGEVQNAGGETLGLLRQLLDESGDIQQQKMVAANLRTGQASPGFSVVQTGAIWEIQVIKKGYGENESGEGAKFHVRVRN